MLAGNRIACPLSAMFTVRARSEKGLSVCLLATHYEALATI